MKYHEMKKKRDTIARQMRELNDKAKEEKRAFTDDETTQWRGMTSELEGLDSQIEREDQLRAQDERFVREDDNKDTNNGEESPTEQRQAEAFTSYLRHGFAELSQEDKAQLRALGTATGAGGGFTVPKAFVNRVVESMAVYGGIANVCQVINTQDGRAMPWAVSDGRTEIGEMLAENQEAGKGDPTFSQVEIGAKKGSSKIVLVSNELLQDSMIDIDAFVARRIGQRLGRLEAGQIITGDNTGNNLKGLNLQVQLKQEAAAVSGVSYADLINLKHKVDPAYRNSPNTRWAFNDDTFKGFKLMNDSNGRPLWLPAIAGVAPSTIDGDQYVIDQGIAAAGASAKSVFYGDWMSLVLRRVTYMNLRRLTERYAEFDQMGFIGFHRFDVLLEDVAAIAALEHAAA
ncbi:phage major capsid protein [Vibrio alginolyticus]|uniref:phage major capsid protein n=1 Tax=Vibrio TaxID=662 RepID=UPI001EEA31A6|nr:MULTISPECIES: phage major capsid protein [Vibrio]MCG6308986.1 phage major capsid protein [Vibrio alginolyticus]MDW3133771.1 phage major capsid protein [Vibrio sp. 1288]